MNIFDNHQRKVVWSLVVVLFLIMFFDVAVNACNLLSH